jgi:hypothetical protein
MDGGLTSPTVFDILLLQYKMVLEDGDIVLASALRKRQGHGGSSFIICVS